jgi:Na+/H+-dicarboxylate symporter
MELLGFPGEILLSMLRALVVPLIMSSIVVGITSLGTTTCAVLCLLLTTHAHTHTRTHAHTHTRTHAHTHTRTHAHTHTRTHALT